MDVAAGFFRVAWDPRGYLGLAYLLARLPLSAAYLLLLVGGGAIGLSMVPVAGAGLVLLLGLLVVIRGCALFERELARSWFGLRPLPMAAPVAPDGNQVHALRRFLSNRVTWSAPIFLALEVPFGLVGFVALCLLLVPAAGLLAALPVYLVEGGALVGGSALATFGPFQVPPHAWPAGPAWLLPEVVLGIALALSALHLARIGARAHVQLVALLLGLNAHELELA